VLASDGLVRVLNRNLQNEHGISLHEYEVLWFLAVFSDDKTMKSTELRRRTPISQSRVSRVVSGLEAEGLVVRETDPTDGRVVRVTITENGIKTLNAARGGHQQDLHEHLFSRLTDPEIHQFGSIAAKIRGTGPPINEPDG
jgi:DNA-binding MarR family transcriptional regulator